ncbi:uncharacterized protein LOC131175821 [Hevea brasiliensis]|uniref:uncharacterized protein LOC131175821 n=1 Tax=Hevea brasiliensis TaxID=3981 RepID=UPI0025DBC189|nr:uncharacterized protein LOC131175821 [Hevea brasiliensis]
MAKESIDEIISSYILHPSDNPRSLLVSCLLKEDDYYTWRRAMINALRAKNKYGFIDGTLEKPAENSSDLVAWIKGNSMVISWIFNSLHSSLQDSIAYFDTAKEVWEDLQERLSQGNTPCVYQLKMDIVNTQQKDQTVAVYYTRLKGLWDEQNSYSSVPICTSGAAKELTNEKEKENVHQFLMGLNEKYSIVRSQILNTEPLPSLARAYALVTQEER